MRTGPVQASPAPALSPVAQGRPQPLMAKDLEPSVRASTVTKRPDSRTTFAGRKGRATTATVWLAMLLLAIPIAANAQPKKGPAAPAGPPVGVETAPLPDWETYGPGGRPAGLRPMTAAEVQQARQRNLALYEVVQAAPSFHLVPGHARYATGDARVEKPGTVQQDFVVYWSRPDDVRRRAHGALWPVLGGAHQLLYFQMNVTLRAEHFAKQDEFSRRDAEAVHGGYFTPVEPLGQLGGGWIYADGIVFTRDGLPPFEPAPIGALLELEIARLSKMIEGDVKRGAEIVRRIEAQWTPEKRAESRARRDKRWARDFPDPEKRAKRILEEERIERARDDETVWRHTLPAQPDPRHPMWQPRLGIQAAQQLRASLDAQGRRQPACGRIAPNLPQTLNVRYEVVGSPAAGTQCSPLVMVRDLVDPKRPAGEIQMVFVYFRGSRCGELWAGRVLAPMTERGERCSYGVPLLREMDWGAFRRAIGWS
jgi:hypothetical protein